MLHTLHIQNLALIESAEWSPAAGLNVVSGETGGGKSLLIQALKLLRGDRAAAAGAGAGAGLVRHGADELRVDGEFRLSAARDAELAGRIRTLVRQACGVELEDDLLVLTRIVDRQGRSRVRIAGRPATLQALRQLGEQLLEIHGQGDSRLLARADSQAELLDAYARAMPLRRQFAAALAHARQLRDQLEARRGGAAQRQQRVDFLRFQHHEMRGLRLREGELEALEREHRRLANLDALRQRLQQALAAMQDDETSAGDRLAAAHRSLLEAAAHDDRLAAPAEQLDAVQGLLADVCREVQSALAGLDLDPGRLAEVEARLDEVHAALRRYGPTEADFRRRSGEVAAELEQLEAAADDPERLVAALEQATASAAAVGRRLLAARRGAAEALGTRLAAELAGLGMPHAAFRTAMARDFDDRQLLVAATPQGPVPVDLQVRINPGEPFRSMRETASGGELARIVLAVKRVLAEHDGVPVLVFDEIDAEVGGRLGAQVGAVLQSVARHHQVVVVTHLPQVASCADRHFCVSKRVEATMPAPRRGPAGQAAAPGGAAADDAGQRTRAEIRSLSGEAVARELRAMAGDAPPQRRRRERAGTRAQRARPRGR